MVEPILVSLRAFDGKQPLHWEGVAYHENIGLTCFILMRSSVWIAIKPSVQRSILPEVEDVDDQHTLCKGPFQSIFVGWSSPTWWCRCEGDLK